MGSWPLNVGLVLFYLFSWLVCNTPAQCFKNYNMQLYKMAQKSTVERHCLTPAHRGPFASEPSYIHANCISSRPVQRVHGRCRGKQIQPFKSRQSFKMQTRTGLPGNLSHLMVTSMEVHMHATLPYLQNLPSFWVPSQDVLEEVHKRWRRLTKST